MSYPVADPGRRPPRAPRHARRRGIADRLRRRPGRQRPGHLGQPESCAVVKEYENSSWANLKSYLDAASAQTAAPVIAKYLGKLAAADVFTFDNAFTVFEFVLREDGGELGPFGIHP